MTILKLFLVLFTINASLQSFNIQTGTNLWLYSMVSYCEPENIKNWSVDYAKKALPAPYVTHVIFREEFGIQAFVSYTKTTNLITISFRGSENKFNWKTNFDLQLKPYYNKKCNSCNVHNGF